MSTGPLNSAAPTSSNVIGGVYNVVAPAPLPGQSSAFQLDANGNLLVNIAAGGGSGGVQYVDGTTQATPTGTVALAKNPSNVLHSLALSALGNLNVNLAEGSISGGNAAASPTGAAVPASADYLGVNIAGNLVGVTGFSLTNSKAAAVVIVDGSGNQITSFGGGTQFADNAASGATPTGTLSMGWDSVNSKVRALKVDASQNLNVDVQNASIAVTGTFFQATQPVSIASAIDVSDRTARLLGHVTVDNATLAVTQSGAPWSQNLTQVGGAAVSLGAQTSANSIPVVLASDEATLPVSIAATVNVSVQNATLAVTQSTSPWVVSEATVDATIKANFTNPAPASSSLIGFINNSNGDFVPLGGWMASNAVRSLSVTIMDGGGIQLAVGDNSTPPDVIPVGIGAMGFDPIANKIRALTVDTNQNLKVGVQNFPALQPVSVVSLPLPTGASTDANLISGNSITAQMMIILEATRRAIVALACEGGRNNPKDFDPNIIAAEEGYDDFAD